MPQYRKKPVVIEAEQFLGCIPDALSLLDDPRIIMKQDGSELLITTLEGVMKAEPGDWIIQGVQGELYPCKDAIFQATYAPVEDEP